MDKNSQPYPSFSELCTFCVFRHEPYCNHKVFTSLYGHLDYHYHCRLRLRMGFGPERGELCDRIVTETIAGVVLEPIRYPGETWSKSVGTLLTQLF